MSFGGRVGSALVLLTGNSVVDMALKITFECIYWNKPADVRVRFEIGFTNVTDADGWESDFTVVTLVTLALTSAPTRPYWRTKTLDSGANQITLFTA
jgi:hypothetical protein